MMHNISTTKIKHFFDTFIGENQQYEITIVIIRKKNELNQFLTENPSFSNKIHDCIEADYETIKEIVDDYSRSGCNLHNPSYEYKQCIVLFKKG